MGSLTIFIQPGIQSSLFLSISISFIYFFFFFSSHTDTYFLFFCLPPIFCTPFCLFPFPVSLSLFPAGVVDNLQTGGFFNDNVTKSCLFSSVHDAVLHCQSGKTHSHDKVVYEVILKYRVTTIVSNVLLHLNTIAPMSTRSCFCG